MLIGFAFDSVGYRSIGLWFFVSSSVKVREHDEENYSVGEDPVHKQRGVVAVYK
jgi:hypothetical protein